MTAADLFDEQILTDLHRDLHPFRSQIADREQVRIALALARQKRIAAANARLDYRHIDGVGEVVASIDVDLYHRIGLTHGYEVLNSPDFLRCLLRDNPELRVKSKSRHLTVTVPEWDGARAPQLLEDVETAPAEIEDAEFRVSSFELPEAPHPNPKPETRNAQPNCP